MLLVMWILHSSDETFLQCNPHYVLTPDIFAGDADSEQASAPKYYYGNGCCNGCFSEKHRATTCYGANGMSAPILLLVSSANCFPG